MNTQFKIRNLVFAAIAAAMLFTSCDDDDMDMDDDPGIIAEMYVSSNTTGMLSWFSVDEDMMIDRMDLSVQAQDADGIYYDESNDVLYQVNRTSNVVNAYGMIDGMMDGDILSPTATSESDHFANGREMTVSNGQAIVADDDTDDVLPTSSDQFVIYSVTATDIQYQRTFLTPTNLWGIQLVGNDLWAIEDNSSNVVVFNDIFSNDDGDIVSPDKTVEIEGIVRTHGLFYDMETDMMFLTDVGDGGSDSDGAISVISGFQSKFTNQDMISSADQIRIGGNNTMLGNPVDITYDDETGMIFTAERANAGGRVLGFMLPTADANPSPDYNEMVEGASAIYLEE